MDKFELKNKIVAVLAMLGLTAGTYIVGFTDTVKCTIAQHQIDVGEVRLCLSDSEYKQVKDVDFAALVNADYKPEKYPEIAALAAQDDKYYLDIKGVLLGKIWEEKNTDVLAPLHEKLINARPEYLDDLAGALETRIKNDGGVRLNDRNTVVATLNALAKRENAIDLKSFNP